MARGQLDRSGAALRPAALEHRLTAARQRMEGASRLLDSVNPDNLLQRGYVRVGTKIGGKVIATAEAARAAGAITLHFRDGAIDARVERAGGKTYDANKPDQPSLL